jgi:SAM-dependent methyltransferase
MAEIWDDQGDYLAATRSLYHNADYWRFLVRDVWGIDQGPRRVVDFGCGFGWIGTFLMPMLAAGSDYTGIDISSPLLERGRGMSLAWPARFVEGDACETPFDDGAFDVAICHALLMHLPRPGAALAEMIRVTRPGGLVITCEVSHNAVNALLHVHETNEQEHMPLSLLQAMNARLRHDTGLDHNIGMKVPVLMHQAGLADVQVRISDAVRLSFPPLDTPEKEQVFTALCDDGLGAVPTDDASFARAVGILIGRGASEADAAAELRREMANDYRNKGRSYHIVQPGLITLSFARVAQ